MASDLALACVALLREAYPDADCTLAYDDAWKLLVSVRLAAQCTDQRVNEITPGLFARWPSVEALAQADPAEIEEVVRPCGLGRSKARDISACMRMLLSRFGGKVPGTMEELLSLPGVGRKSANLILGDVFGQSAVVTDTHCIRLSNRIGLVHGVKDPRKVEDALRAALPPEESTEGPCAPPAPGRSAGNAASGRCASGTAWTRRRTDFRAGARCPVFVPLPICRQVQSLSIQVLVERGRIYNNSVTEYYQIDCAPGPGGTGKVQKKLRAPLQLQDDCAIIRACRGQAAWIDRRAALSNEDSGSHAGEKGSCFP